MHRGQRILRRAAFRRSECSAELICNCKYNLYFNSSLFCTQNFNFLFSFLFATWSQMFTSYESLSIKLQGFVKFPRWSSVHVGRIHSWVFEFSYFFHVYLCKRNLQRLTRNSKLHTNQTPLPFSFFSFPTQIILSLQYITSSEEDRKPRTKAYSILSSHQDRKEKQKGLPFHW